ncbi:DUF2628 domain-containing protein [Loigolactobacillus coryniformis]|uniref:DUF2628 domain-containing protein n=1 Tax=Loigolactobacillus coryniformis TaxID=1610 RepID=A0A5B8TI35_9LACO|nr:DUF2628 domain-containing protein [Loigolactobacillus coryniformis]QEA53602.1 DUF2628 domain-containing protein [Loigolactobacillus coryniformis]
MRANLSNPRTNQLKQVKVGFSWTTFFFGFWPALFRGDWLWAVIGLIIQLFIGLPSYGIGASIYSIIFAFIYNRIYINKLLSQGYQAADSASKQILLNRNFTLRD